MKAEEFSAALSSLAGAESYSGRGMMGKACVGFRGDSVVKVIEHVLQEVWSTEDDDMMDYLVHRVIGQAQWDSMGHGSIIYWPDIPFVAPSEDGLEGQDEDSAVDGEGATP